MLAASASLSDTGWFEMDCFATESFISARCSCSCANGLAVSESDLTDDWATLWRAGSHAERAIKLAVRTRRDLYFMIYLRRIVLPLERLPKNGLRSGTLRRGWYGLPARESTPKLRVSQF